MALAAAAAELLVVWTAGWAGDYQQVLQRTSDAVEPGHKSNRMLRNIVQMVTTTQDNANN